MQRDASYALRLFYEVVGSTEYSGNASNNAWNQNFSNGNQNNNNKINNYFGVRAVRAFGQLKMVVAVGRKYQQPLFLISIFMKANGK